jgi:SAM-dependent methyltransferase
MTGAASCWCGNADLLAFCAGYRRCPACETLVSDDMPGPEISHVVDEERDFYGREYWFSYQEKHLGHPTILARARSDLPERCLYWLQALLKYKRPPARVLELGSGHGGFVAMLRSAGFDATGLEISPWVVEFARGTFEVPMLLGPVEDQRIEPASLDVIALMDVLEHLRDPVGTMRHCLGLLKPDGILLIQTPCYPEGSTYEEMVARSGQSLEILQPGEHLYLFSRRSLRDLFNRLGAGHIVFEPAFFAQYDMFAAVSRLPVTENPEIDAVSGLSGAPAVRMVQALLDLGGKLGDLQGRYERSEEDRARRLEVIEAQGRQLGEVEAERNNLRAEVDALRQHRDVIEADRAARLEVIETQGRRLSELEGEIGAQARRPSEADAEIEAQRQQIGMVMGQLRTLQRVIRGVQGSRAFRLLRRLGYWRFVDEAMGEAVPAAVTALGSDREVADGSISTLTEYRACIDRFNASQDNAELLDGIRSYNDHTVDELNRIRPLRGMLLLDIGASPHGYALQRALEHGAALYVGVGLDIPRRELVIGDHGIGLLLKADAASLPLPADAFDLVLSLSTLEHVLDVDSVLSEMARVLRSGGLALLTFEPIWSCSYGHHLHHFGECAKVVPPWGHLTCTPEQFRLAMTARWPQHAPLSLDQAIEWVYFGREINRLTVRDYRDHLVHPLLEVEWMVELKEPDPDKRAAQQAALATGMSVEDLTTKGLSVLLRRRARP